MPSFAVRRPLTQLGRKGGSKPKEEGRDWRESRSRCRNAHRRYPSYTQLQSQKVHKKRGTLSNNASNNLTSNYYHTTALPHPLLAYCYIMFNLNLNTFMIALVASATFAAAVPMAIPGMLCDYSSSIMY